MKKIHLPHNYLRNFGSKAGYLLALAVFIVSILFSASPASAQDSNPITGYGMSCADIQSIHACFDFELTFVVIGGNVQAVGYSEQEITQNGVTVTVISNYNYTGSFEGGDGGYLTGTWTGDATIYLPEGESYSEPSNGTWEGNLYANGTGSGVWTGESLGQTGTWSISYSAEEFQAGLPPAPTPSPSNTKIPPTAQPTPEPTRIQASPTPIPSISGVDNSDDQGAGSSDELDPALESEAADAAGDPLNAVSGAAVGTVLGGLLALLASRASDLADSGSELVADLQTAFKDLQEQGVEPDLAADLSPENKKKLEKLIDSVKINDEMAAAFKGKLKEPEGYLKGLFRKLSASKDSAYKKLGEAINALNIAENLGKLRGMELKALKKLGPISFFKNLYDRTNKLLKERGDEPLHYQASTVLEATVVEALKTVATLNPYIFLTDQAIGQAGGKPPSDYVADKSHNFIQRYYIKWHEKSAPENVEGMERRLKDMRKQAKEFKEEFEAKIKSGEISKEEGEEKLRGILRAYRYDYAELSEKLNKFNASLAE